LLLHLATGRDGDKSIPCIVPLFSTAKKQNMSQSWCFTSDHISSVRHR